MPHVLKVLKGLLWRNLFSYLDELILMSQRVNKHLRLLKTVLQRFREHKLKINAEKSEFAVGEILLLSNKISKECVSLEHKN